MGGRGSSSASSAKHASSYQGKSDHQTTKDYGRITDVKDISELNFTVRMKRDSPASYEAAKKLIGLDPDTIVTVYRGDRSGSANGELNTGDWIGIAEDVGAAYALTPFGNKAENGAMYSFKVRAGDIYIQYTAGYYGYFGKSLNKPFAKEDDVEKLRKLRGM